MYLQSLASAFPESTFTQEECWDILEASPEASQLRPGSLQLMHRILTEQRSGIERRHFSVEDPGRLFRQDAEALNRLFEVEAPSLASTALMRALDRAGITVSEVDALLVCTCTGYLCPGVSSHVAEALGLKPNAFLQDLVGLGCGAAIPLLRAARGLLAAEPGITVATIAVEVSSAAFYLCDDPGVLVSLCLFGDGAAAALWRAQGLESQWRADGFDTVHRPEDREKIRFVNAGGKLRNQLHPAVPRLAADAVAELYQTRLNGLPDQAITHSGGRDVIEEVEARLEGCHLEETRDVLRQRGNVSSPSVLLALEERLGGPERDLDRHLWLSAFGAGFAAHAFELSRDL